MLASNGLHQPKRYRKEKILDKGDQKTEIGFAALSVPNLENVEELVADGSVVASEVFIEESKQERLETENERRHKNLAIGDDDSDKVSFYFYPTDSLIRRLKDKHSIMPKISAMSRGDTILRCNPGRRSDLGSVGPKCFSWSGPQSENEAKVGESLAHLVGRKGGMV